MRSLSKCPPREVATESLRKTYLAEMKVHKAANRVYKCAQGAHRVVIGSWVSEQNRPQAKLVMTGIIVHWGPKGNDQLVGQQIDRARSKLNRHSKEKVSYHLN